MMCPICRQGETHPGSTMATLERGELTFVAKDLPAMVCANCGEEYIDEKTAGRLLKTAGEAVKAGVQVDVRTYRAA